MKEIQNKTVQKANQAEEMDSILKGD